MDEHKLHMLLENLTLAVRSIAHGGREAPGGLEGLTMAISGEGNQSPLSSEIGGAAQTIADSNDRVADAISDLAKAVRESHAKG